MNFLALVAAMTVALCNAQAGGVLDDGENFHLLMNKNFVRVSDEEDVLMKARFQQDCLIEETQDKFACRELLDGCGINVLNQAPDEGEEGGHSASRRARNCHFVLKKECEENHFSSALCRAMFLQDSVSHLRTNSAVTTAMDDPFVKDVMITGPSYHGCDQTDEDAKYECLGEKVGQGLDLVQNIAGGINSPDDLFNIAEGALELMGRLHPAVGAGLEIARMIFGSSGGEVDHKHEELLGRFDNLDRKLDEIAEAVGNIDNVIATAICNQEIQGMITSLENYQIAYDNILTVRSTEAIITWDKTCMGETAGVKNILYFMNESINLLTNDGLGMSCAKEFYESEPNKEGKYLSTVVQPLVQKLTRGMKLVLDCPRIYPHNYKNLHEKLTTKIYEEFKQYLTKARTGWKEGAKALSKDWAFHKSADAIRWELENYLSHEYVYSVLRIHSIGRRDNQLGYFEHSGEKYGLFVAKRPDDQDSGLNVFIFYRKKFTGYDIGFQKNWNMCGTETPEWKYTDRIHNFCMRDGWPYDDACDDAWYVIRLPEKRGSTHLQGLLEKGSILANRKNTIMHDFSSVPHYELESRYTFEEGFDHIGYQLYYPKHKTYMSNVALNMFASQSSTASGFPASKAVSGCTDGLHIGSSCSYSSKGFTHTQAESNPWWKVDLGEITWVNSIRIFNRAHYQNRLKNVIVEVIDTTETDPTTNKPGKVMYRKQYDEDDGIINRHYTFGNINVKGDVVRVSLMGKNRVLTLAEVEVYNDF